MKRIVCTALMALLLTPLAMAQSGKKLIVVRQIVKPGMVEQVIEWAQPLMELTPKEPGCISYNLCRSINNPDELFFVEIYKDQDAVKAHNKQPHLATFCKLRDPHLVSKPEVRIVDIP